MNSTTRPVLVVLTLVLLLAPRAATEAAVKQGPVKVFILAGQSNMEGQAVADLDGKHYNEGRGTLNFLTHDFVRKPEDSPNPSHGHHEFGNAETYFLVGDALGKAMVKLLDSPRPQGDAIRQQPRAKTLPKSEVGVVTEHHQGLHGYIGFRHEPLPPQSAYNAGMGFYAAVWPLAEQPLANFQIGLPSAWITPDNSTPRTQRAPPTRSSRRCGSRSMPKAGRCWCKT